MSNRSLALIFTGALLSLTAPQLAQAQDPITNAIDALVGNPDYHLDQAISHTGPWHNREGH
jgi:hypothetical protein